LLGADADPNAVDARATTPLHWAVVCNRPDVCRLLLERGARVALRDAQGMTPLHYATEKRFHECVNTLQRFHTSTRPLTAHANAATLLQPNLLTQQPTSGKPSSGGVLSFLSRFNNRT
jgi:ankyrin repeat protein